MISILIGKVELPPGPDRRWVQTAKILPQHNNSKAIYFPSAVRPHRIGISYIQPGRPDQNPLIERFNRPYRAEVLDAYLFDSPEQLRAITEELARDLQHRAAP